MFAVSAKPRAAAQHALYRSFPDNDGGSRVNGFYVYTAPRTAGVCGGDAGEDADPTGDEAAGEICGGDQRAGANWEPPARASCRNVRPVCCSAYTAGWEQGRVNCAAGQGAWNVCLERAETGYNIIAARYCNGYRNGMIPA